MNSARGLVAGHRLSVASVALFIAAACGGGGGPATPTQPAPIPAVDACNLIGGTGSTPGLPILNGAECSAERSSVVLLNMRAADGQTPLGACTGTIVAPRVVLTAAHCLDEDVRVVRVWLGPPTAEVTAESFVFYPGYRFNIPNSFDVGLVMMAEDLGRGAFPILTSRDARPGEAAILVGWGRDQQDRPATLRAGSTTISGVNAAFLETIYAPPASSICSGDSGGPILLSEGGGWAVAGIASATSQNACNTGTNFYQSIRHPSVSGFILEHLPNIGRR